MSRALQTARIREIGKALTAAGYRHIDSQAEVLGLSRSTAWTILQGNHKHTGLTASVVHQMLESEKLPASVRSKIVEYVAEKLLGHHGHSEKQILYFAGRLSIPWSMQASGPLNRSATPQAPAASHRTKAEPQRQMSARCRLHKANTEGTPIGA